MLFVICIFLSSIWKKNTFLSNYHLEFKITVLIFTVLLKTNFEGGKKQWVVERSAACTSANRLRGIRYVLPIILMNVLPSLEKRVSAGLRIPESLQLRATDFVKCQNFNRQLLQFVTLRTAGTRTVNYWIWINTSRIYEILSLLSWKSCLIISVNTNLYLEHSLLQRIQKHKYSYKEKSTYKPHLFLCSRFHTLKHSSMKLLKNWWCKGMKCWKSNSQGWSYIVQKVVILQN